MQVNGMAVFDEHLAKWDAMPQDQVQHNRELSGKFRYQDVASGHMLQINNSMEKKGIKPRVWVEPSIHSTYVVTVPSMKFKGARLGFNGFKKQV